MKTLPISKWLFCIVMAYLLAGCAQKLSKPIDEPIESIPSVQEVRTNIDSYIGRRVRWGGVIASVRNEKTETILDIVSRPLDGTGRPYNTDTTDGRFIARINRFLDPVVYSNGREITVVGVINGQSTREIDQYEYVYPEVNVSAYKLWATRERSDYYYYDPFWYDPWYHRYYFGPPYYPWYYY